MKNEIDINKVIDISVKAGDDAFPLNNEDIPF